MSPLKTHSLYLAALSGLVTPNPSREAAAFLKPANSARSTPDRLCCAGTFAPVPGSTKFRIGRDTSYQEFCPKLAGSVLAVSIARYPATTSVVFLNDWPSSSRTTRPPPLAPPKSRSISILLNRTSNDSVSVGVYRNCAAKFLVPSPSRSLPGPISSTTPSRSRVLKFTRADNLSSISEPLIMP